MHPPYWQQAIEELSASDELLGKIIARYPNEAMESKDDAFHTLMRSITGQQISVKAADSIWGRLVVKVDNKIKPDAMKNLSFDDLRAIGYSRQKISYIESLSDFFLSRQHLERDWQKMTDDELTKDITQIKGIGIWTAEMFLMFYLLRPNVLPLGDIGLTNAIDLHYPTTTERKKKDYAALAERWQPWRSVATWYLWRTYDDEAVSY